MTVLLDELHRDHQAVLQLAKGLADCQPPLHARRCTAVFRRLQRQLDVHLCIEDEVLMPMLESESLAWEKKASPLDWLRSEHRQIRHTIGVISGALANQDWRQLHAESRQLWLDLRRLETYEQEQLYPMVAERLSASALDMLWYQAMKVRRQAGAMFRLTCPPQLEHF